LIETVSPTPQDLSCPYWETHDDGRKGGKMKRRFMKASEGRYVTTGLKAFIAIISAAVLFGCARPITHIRAFSIASEDLATQAIRGYEALNETTVKRKISEVAADPEELPDENTFVGLLEGKESLAIRMMALDYLRDYSAALGDLSTADVRPDVDRASKDLYGALIGLRNSFKKETGKDVGIGNEDLAIIATAVDSIGTIVVEAKRRTAIKTIVITADPAVQNVSKLLRDEIPIFGEFVKSNLSTIETEMIKSYQKRAKKLTFDQRVKYIQRIRKQHQVVKESGDFFKDLGTAAEMLGASHAALREAVEKNKFTTPELIEQIGELVDFTKSLRKFNKGLLGSM
jgi:hypothetical protein